MNCICVNKHVRMLIPVENVDIEFFREGRSKTFLVLHGMSALGRCQKRLFLVLFLNT